MNSDGLDEESDVLQRLQWTKLLALAFTLEILSSLLTDLKSDILPYIGQFLSYLSH
jgi:hypothetical protein